MESTPSHNKIPISAKVWNNVTEFENSTKF